jgi:hypothetical protein
MRNESDIGPAAGHTIREFEAGSPCSPIEGLPDDVLRCVATFAIQDFFPHPWYVKALVALTAVSVRFRALVLGTPTLWTHIDSRWPADVQDAFAARAASAPLRLHFDSSAAAIARHRRHREQRRVLDESAQGQDPLLAGTTHALRWLARAVRVAGRLYSQAQWSSFFAALNRGAPCLRELQVLRDRRAGPQAALVCYTLAPQSYPLLTDLTLDCVPAEDMPSMPSLRRLSLLNVLYSLALVQQACVRAPGVEHLTVRQGQDRMHQPVEPIGQHEPLARVPLPHLQRLEVAGWSGWLPDVLAFLPDPATCLRVTTWGFWNNTWSSAAPTERAIIARLTAFWAGVTGTDGAWPAGTIITSDMNTQVLFGAEQAGAAPSFLYCALCRRVDAVDPLLAHVGVLEIHVGRSAASALNVSRIDLRRLSAVQTLVVREADFSAGNDYEDAHRALWAWVEARHRDGTPLREVRFERCFDGDGVVRRLVDGGLATSVSGEDWRPCAWWDVYNRVGGDNLVE